MNYDNAGSAVLVGVYLGREALRSEERLGGLGVLVVALDPGLAIRGEVLRELERDATDEVEAIIARAERERGLVVGDACGEGAGGRDVGRVCGNDVEDRIAEWLEEVADTDRGARFIQMVLSDIFKNSYSMCRVHLAEGDLCVR